MLFYENSFFNMYSFEFVSVYRPEYAVVIEYAITDNLSDIEIEQHNANFKSVCGRVRSEMLTEIILFQRKHIDELYPPLLKYLLDYYVTSSYTQKVSGNKHGRSGDPGWRPIKKRRTRFKVKTTQKILRSFR